jgi:catechol 2,3-dioxygenase-like lactoylglutathione lyase family enzyme
MTHRGFSHLGLSTLDLDKTRAFYEGVLGFEPGWRRHDDDRRSRSPGGR